MRPVYLDYAASTPVDPEVAKKMVDYLTLDGVFANPASRSHIYGWQAEEAVETARQSVANLIGAESREIVWTSGATESDNLAIKGVIEQVLLVRGEAAKPIHIVTSAIEHKAVLDTCRYLQSRYEIEVTYLEPDAMGLIHPEQVHQALRPDTALVSLMHVNNELGTVTDVATIARITREHGVVFHVDAAQSAGKLAIDVGTMPIDLISLSSHKIYGPKGIGALYVRRSPQVKLVAQIHGGGHERGMRSGTLATHQIVGMGEAFKMAARLLDQDCERITALREKLWQGLSQIDGAHLNGDPLQRVSGIVNVAFEGVEGETLMMALSELAVASGSACNSASVAPSYVVKSLGLSDQLALASVRFSLGRFTTDEEIEFTSRYLQETLSRLRA